MELETVTIFRTWIEIADALKSDAERGKLYHAICRYSLYGEPPQLEGLLQSYFTLMRPSIDKSNRRKFAQQNSSQKRLQNRLQTDLQNEDTTELQNESKSDLQTKSQNDTTHAHKTGTGTKKKREPNGSPKEADASFVDQIPEILKNPTFEAKWIEWEAFRRSKRKPISQLGATGQFRLLAKYPADAVEMIDFSIANDYQGIFPLKNRPKLQPIKDYNGI